MRPRILSALFLQIPEAGTGGGESAGAVKFCQSWLVIDVQPFDSLEANLARAGFDQFSADASSLPVRRDGGVDKKPVHAAIADDLGKADELFSFIGAHINPRRARRPRRQRAARLSRLQSGL